MSVDSKFKGISVAPKSNEQPDKLIKRFIRKCRSEGILQEVYLRRSYEKPSDKRRRKEARAKFISRSSETDES